MLENLNIKYDKKLHNITLNCCNCLKLNWIMENVSLPTDYFLFDFLVITTRDLTPREKIKRVIPSCLNASENKLKRVSLCIFDKLFPFKNVTPFLRLNAIKSNRKIAFKQAELTLLK
ncbi:hypothetical protein BpHYR1_035888, partial [Brachionus plicatilis]